MIGPTNGMLGTIGGSFPDDTLGGLLTKKRTARSATIAPNSHNTIAIVVVVVFFFPRQKQKGSASRGEEEEEEGGRRCERSR